MITLIGTPPNIIIAAFREDALGTSYQMFDFAPVGLACTVAGVLFIALLGWRLIPAARSQHDTLQELFELQDYIAEVKVPSASKAIGQKVRELDAVADDAEAAIIGLVRNGQQLPGMARRVEIAADDVLVFKASPANIDKLVGALASELGFIVFS